MWWTVPADDGDRQDVSISSSRTYIRSLRIVVLLLPLFISFFWLLRPSPTTITLTKWSGN